MKFSKEEIDFLNQKGIPIDEREYSTDEIFRLEGFVESDLKLSKEMHWFVFGPPTSIRFATPEQRKNWPKVIKKEDIKECPLCKNNLEILNDNKYQYYNCTNLECNYKSYIIDEAFEHYLLIENT